jgi:glycosyltransferase involved in cell wall biosynthesis
VSSPSVTIVFLVYNRREELRTSLNKMLSESDYEGAVDVIVVDNASTDGSGQMLRDEFPDVRVISHERNVGVSGWNAGFAVAEGDWILALDDDCYLPADGLRRAIEAAEAHRADLVSFKVTSTHDPTHFFDEEWPPGLFGFWGCAVLVRTPVVQELEGYDPEIFVWFNETEFTIRLLDHGYRHLHLPEVVAQHMKKPLHLEPFTKPNLKPRFTNARHFGYTAAKLLRPRDALGTLVGLVANELRDGVRINWRCALAAPYVVRGFAHGLKHRSPVRPEVSRCYRKNYWTFANPWWLSRRPTEVVRALPREIAQRRVTEGKRQAPSSRRDEYFAKRARYYPDRPAVLEL